MQNKSPERTLLIGGLPGSKIFYIGFPDQDDGLRVDGLEETSNVMESVLRVYPHSKIGFKGVSESDQTFFLKTQEALARTNLLQS